MKEKKTKVLLLGASTQSAIYVAKQLHKYGLEISVIDWHNVPIKHSKFVDRYFSFVSPIDDEKKFSQMFLEHVASENYSAVLPIHDPAVEICQEHFEELSKHTVVLNYNRQATYQFAHDKRTLFDIAVRIGINVPSGFYIESLSDLDSIIDKVSFPCVVKPSSSSVIKFNSTLELKVNIAKNKEQLIDFVREYINAFPLILQEFVHGFGIGYNIIAKDGEILNAYIHRRINESHGVSSYRESLPSETYGIKANVEKLIKEINWSGVAMVEFKVDGEKIYLMEMNGRFWGSIEVGIKSGLNYPVQLYEMHVLKKEIQRNIPYKLVRVRNLREEMILFGAQLFQGNGKVFFQWFFSLFNSFRANDFIEDNIFSDPGFVLALYKKDLKRIFKKLFGKTKKAEHRTLNLDGIQKRKIGFVCFGNICRSPFAELYILQKKSAHEFYSFGSFPVEERYSPIVAVEAARKFNVDLLNHKSKRFRKEWLSTTDYFIVMDDSNYFELIKYGVDKNKIYFLSDTQIEDPYQKDLKYFEQQYKKIVDAIDQLII